MAWCSVKHRDNFNFAFTFTFYVRIGEKRGGKNNNVCKKGERVFHQCPKYHAKKYSSPNKDDKMSRTYLVYGDEKFIQNFSQET
jgi:hypothetical protein